MTGGPSHFRRWAGSDVSGVTEASGIVMMPPPAPSLSDEPVGPASAVGRIVDREFRLPAASHGKPPRTRNERYERQ